MTKAAHRIGGVIGVGAAAAALAAVSYVGTTWLRYGKEAPSRGRGGPPLDRFLPGYEVREYHETKVAAPADLTFVVARELDMQRSGLVRAIFRGRELLMGSEPTKREQSKDFLSEVLALGWRVLAEEPGRELVMGAVTQPWNADVEFRGLTSEEFTAFSDPGYAKIAWTMAVEPAGPDSSIFGRRRGSSPQIRNHGGGSGATGQWCPPALRLSAMKC